MNSSMMTVLMGVRHTDGLCSFERKVLFYDAATWTQNALIEAGFHEAQTVVCENESLSCIELSDEVKNVLIITRAMPELTHEDFTRMASLHNAVGQDITILCTDKQNSSNAVLRNADYEVRSIGQGYGEKALHAVIFRTDMLKKVQQKANNLFDAVNLAAENGAHIEICHVCDVTEITDGVSAYEAQKKLMSRIAYKHIANGVHILSPDSTFISPDAVIEAGASILPGTIIRSECTIGAGAVIGPNSLLEKAKIGANTTVNSSQVAESTVGCSATVGPFAYVRPGCEIGDKTRIGDFVELKKAKIGNGTKVSHLTYIGDADVGERVNFGCGTVIVNYDGYHKYKTTIGDDCFIGCNTNLIAPVTLGDRVFTAAGTTVTKDVPDGALTVARARQTNLEGWNDRRRERMQNENK